jgi:alpha-D-xyloside xylohydrolase
MLEKGYMLGNRLIYDAFNPDARALYWEQARKNLFSKGVDAWWCDCSEPFESDWRGEIKPEPAQRMWLNTEEAKKYLDPANINLYSVYHSQGIYEGQRSVRQDKRVLNLTRSSYAGQHRSATVTWSGDVSASWETLRRQIPEGLNFCVTGEPYWSTDIGGFFPMGGKGPWFLAGDFNMGVKDLGYRELFVRWMQYSVFLPMMRVHGTGTPREIWQFGEKGEPFYDAIEQAIRLRYRLIPYLYSLMAQTNREGLSMLRIPALMFPEDAALRGVDDEMMLGDAILVKPVTRPMYYHSGSQAITGLDEHIDVVLPAGCRWYAMDSGECYEGGQTIAVTAPLKRIPAFVREGTILPWGAPVQCTPELRSAPLELIVYPGADGRCRLYDDAGDGYGYEKGESVTVQLSWDDALGELTIEPRQGHCPELLDVTEFCIHRVDGPAQTLAYDGRNVTVRL